MAEHIPYKTYFEKAQWYLRQIDDISIFIESTPIMPKKTKQKLQTMMKNLKESLSQDCKIASSVRKMKGMTPEEGKFYLAALEAKAKLKVRSNSDPIRSNWFSHLHDCRYIFQGYLDYLSSMIKEIY